MRHLFAASTVLVVLLATLPGCHEPSASECSSLTCPDGLVCAPSGDRCVLPEQLGECDGIDDGVPCTFGGTDGMCLAGACQVTCGNGVVELDEVCDDGNTVSGDGCRADCSSEERCGNSIIDFDRGEFCDDGNARSHDGCSSACTIEVAEWEDISLPSIRVVDGFAIAYDGTAGQVAVLGGRSGSYSSPHTWHLAGNSWRRSKRTTFPAAVTSAKMVYDSANQRLVAFGGADTYVGYASTRVFDENGWSKLSGTGTPSARTGHGMVYDEARGVVVLYGGAFVGPLGLLGDTWEFDGTTWTNKDPVASPGYVSDPGMVYDPVRQRVYTAGGTNYFGEPRIGTWEWDGVNWQQLTPIDGPCANPAGGCNTPTTMAFDYDRGVTVALTDEGTWEFDGDSWVRAQVATEPPPRPDAGMAYDRERGAMVVVGEHSIGGVPETWIYNGTMWTRIDGTNPRPPAGRTTLPYNIASNERAAYDSLRSRVVLFDGGERATWEFDGVDWAQKIVGSGPLARHNYGLAFDAARNRTVLFGGARNGDHVSLGDTWEWDGTTWELRSPTVSPERRVDPTLVFDTAREVTVMFGGVNEVEALGTWEYNGLTWTPSADGGPDLPGTAAAYDPIRGKVVAFGGRRLALLPGIAPALGDTWEYDGIAWERIETPTAPAYRSHAAMVYDALSGRILLFGGTDLPGGAPIEVTWAYDGVTWAQISTVQTPGQRAGHAMSVFPPLGGVVLFGGAANSNLTDFRDDTWLYRLGSTIPDEICDNGIDDDADEITDCDDPDCAIAAVCL